MSDLIYYGVWINWSRGKYDGSTITLSPRNAGLLVAFLAIFVSVAGGSLWRIFAFCLHQERVTRNPRDGLHYQQQAILRNAATPGVAAWQFTLLISPWRKLSKRPIWRSSLLIITAVVILSVFFAAGVLVAEVTRTTGSEVLVHSDSCGNWTLDTTKLVYGFQTKTLNDTVRAATYSQACYGGPSNALECNQYETQALPYTVHEGDACPFQDGMCLLKHPVFTLDTGNVSTHDHLGINSKPQDRLLYRRKTTCAPLKSKGFINTLNYPDAVNASIGNFNGQDGDTLDFFNFGPVVYQGAMRSNFTFYYNRRAATVGYAYDLSSVDHASGDGINNTWVPDEAVSRDDGDVSLMFLAANNILYYGKVEDPIFQATTEVSSIPDDGKNITLYSSDYFVNPLGCVDQHQFCNPVNQKCTNLDSYSTAVRAAQADLQLNPMQYVVVSVLSLDLVLSGISRSIGGRNSAALRAQEVLSGLLSGPIPKDQWKREVEYWFSTGLAKLQRYIVEYATGPLNVLEGTHLSKPTDAPSRQLCGSQKIKAPPGIGATSFSTLGVAIVLAVGGLIILSHMILEYLVANVIATRNYRLLRWALDDKLQLQRLAYEGTGLGTWEAGIGVVPTTTRSEAFGMDISGAKENPTISVLTDEEKEIGTAVTISTVSPGSVSPVKPESRGQTEADTERSDSVQLPPLDFEANQQGDMWPLVNAAADTVSSAQES